MDALSDAVARYANDYHCDQHTDRCLAVSAFGDDYRNDGGAGD